MIQKIYRHLRHPLQTVIKLREQMEHTKRFSEKDREYWRSLKNIHHGKPGFVICNGPSLTMEDLSALKKVVTIASNRIYLAFDKTDWRPTYYTTADVILWEKIKGEIEEYFDRIHIPTYLDAEKMTKTVYWKAKHMGLFQRFSPDLSECAYGGHTITYENLQFAVHLGLNPIYLIGCDHNYPGEKNVRAGEPIKQSEHQSHFIKGYRKPGEIVMPASIVDMEISYREARKFAEANGIEILNATRGGRLEIFKRVNLDSVLSKLQVGG